MKSRLESTAYHESGHAVLWLLEEQYLGGLALVSVLPDAETSGRVRRADTDLGKLTPRKLRAIGRVTFAGAVAQKLAGFAPSLRVGDPDARAIQLAGLLSEQGPEFIRESCAGSEFLLRLNWGAVERVANHLLALGELTQPHGIELLRMDLDGPQRVLAPNTERFFELLTTVEHLPEFARQIDDALRALSAKAA